jgi:hypothetical protein
LLGILHKRVSTGLSSVGAAERRPVGKSWRASCVGIGPKGDNFPEISADRLQP